MKNWSATRKVNMFCVGMAIVLVAAAYVIEVFK